MSADERREPCVTLTCAGRPLLRDLRLDLAIERPAVFGGTNSTPPTSIGEIRGWTS